MEGLGKGLVPAPDAGEAESSPLLGNEKKGNSGGCFPSTECRAGGRKASSRKKRMSKARGKGL